MDLTTSYMGLTLKNPIVPSASPLSHSVDSIKMNLGQIVQSHALSFFHLSAPDFLLGFDSDPAQRNIFGLMAQRPEIAWQGIRLRQFGQEIIEALGGTKIHPALGKVRTSSACSINWSG